MSPIAHVLRAHLVEIVERRVGHGDAADEHRREPRDGRERPGAPHLHLDAEDFARRLFGRKLVRDREPRRARDVAQPFLSGELVHLVHDAVDVVRQRRARISDLAVIREEPVDASHDLPLGCDPEAVIGQIIEELAVPRELRRTFSGAQAVCVEREPARSRNARIELPQRSGRGVARIHELALAFSRCARLSAWKSRLSMSTSPRTSMSAGGRFVASFSGIARIARRFAVTSSPV